MKNEKLAGIVRTSDPKILSGSIFPKAFEDVTQDSYVESQDAFTSIFEDKAKYNAKMSAWSEVIYRGMK